MTIASTALGEPPHFDRAIPARLASSGVSISTSTALRMSFPKWIVSVHHSARTAVGRITFRCSLERMPQSSRAFHGLSRKMQAPVSSTTGSELPLTLCSLDLFFRGSISIVAKHIKNSAARCHDFFKRLGFRFTQCRFRRISVSVYGHGAHLSDQLAPPRSITALEIRLKTLAQDLYTLFRHVGLHNQSYQKQSCVALGIVTDYARFPNFAWNSFGSSTIVRATSSSTVPRLTRSARHDVIVTMPSSMPV